MTLAKLVPSLTFVEAGSLWLQSRSVTSAPGSLVRARFIRANTEKSYQAYLDSLNLFFANLRLEEIHVGHIRQYQEARIAGSPPFIRKRRPNKNVVAAPCPASPKKCNQELSLLKMIMRRAGAWSEELDEFYEPFLEEINDVPRSLSPEQQELWLNVARSQRRWWIVYWYSALGFGTSMGTNEMRALRIGDVNLAHRIVSVPDAGAKNKYRVRTIPLVGSEVIWAAEQLLARASDLGAAGPTDYLFPFRRPPGPWDPKRPMTVSGIKKTWEEVRAASGLKWFRPYDTRHTAITRWAESGMNIAEIQSMAGHMSQRMTRHYMHISEGVKRKAIEAALGKIAPSSETRGFQSTPFYVPIRRA